MKYTIRRNGKVLCWSESPRCGYSVEELKTILAAGYEYFEGEKRVRRIQQ